MTPGVCSVSGSTVTGIAAGTCTIAANQAGNSSYNPAAQVTQSISFSSSGQQVSPPTFSAALLTNLQAYYKMDEASGNALASIGSANLTVTNTTGSVTGKVGNARGPFTVTTATNYFSNTSMPVTFGYNSSFSICGWVKIDDVTTVDNTPIFSTSDSTGDFSARLELNKSTNEQSTLSFYISKAFVNAGDSIGRTMGDKTKKFPVGSVVFFAAIYDGSAHAYQLYINDNYIGYSTNPKTNTAVNTTKLYLMKDLQYGLDHVGGVGYIDEIGVWNKALNASEVAELYSYGTGSNSVNLSVTRAGTGSGTVTSTPAGINCGSTCSASFTGGASVTLTATPASGSTFTGWGGACSGTGSCVVSMSAAKNVTATFSVSATPFAFTDDFSGSLSAWVNQGGNWAISNGKLTVDYNISCGSVGCPQADLVLADQHQPTGDYQASVEFSKTTDPRGFGWTYAQFGLWESNAKKIAIGLGGGVQGAWGGPQTTIGVDIQKWNGSWSMMLPSTSFPYSWNADQTQTATLKKIGNVYSIYINGTHLTDFTDDFLLGAGKIGLHSYGPKVYDNFRIDNISTIESGLLAYYPFEGNANDISGNGKHGTAYGIPSYVANNSGKVLTLDGSDDWIDLPETGYLNSVTVSAFISHNHNSISPNSGGYKWLGIVDNWTGFENFGLFLWEVAPGDIRVAGHFHDRINSNTLYPEISVMSTSLTKGRAYHVAMTYANKMLSLYLDGVLVGSTQTPSSTYCCASDVTPDLRIGKNRDNRYFSGTLDELRLYNRSLNGTEIQQLYVASGQTGVKQALTVAKSGTGTGSVTSSPAGIDCGTDCTESYASGTSVTLTATPASGSYFYGWSGACSGAGSCAVTMSEARSVTATFKTVPFVATTTSNITPTSATVSTTVSFAPADVGKTGAVYVTAWAPANGLGALGILAAPMSHALSVTVTNDNPYSGGKINTRQETLATFLAAADPNAFVLVQLTSTGWQLVQNGQLIPYASGVLGDSMAALSILNNANPSNLLGAQFCVGYGTSAAEMIASGRMMPVADIPGSTVATNGSCNVAANPYKGLWWNPAESGWGMSVTQHDSINFVALYTYDQSAQPVWYVMSDCRIATAGSCSGDIYKVVGGKSPTQPWAALDFSQALSTAGRGTLTFSDTNNGKFDFTLNGVTGSKTIERQLFSNNTAAQALDYTDLWWNANESGWGVALTQDMGMLFAAWYTYDAAGQPVWYVASSCQLSGSGCTGAVYKVTGGEALTAAWNGINPVATVGTVTFAFSDSSTGMMSYTIDGVSGSKAIVRQAF